MTANTDALRQELRDRHDGGDSAGALAVLSQILALDGVTEDGLLWQHVLLSDLGRHAEALETAYAIERIAARKTPWHFVRIGEALLALGRADDAVAWIHRAIAERGFRHARPLKQAPLDALSAHPQYAELLGAAERNTGVGGALPDFEVARLDGGRQRLSDLRGYVVLVDFWSTICPPCVDEMPRLKRLYEHYASDGFTILGVSLDSDVAAARAFLTEHKIAWPNACSGDRWADPTAKLLNVHATPSMWLLDRSGIVRAFDLRGDDLERAVRDLLAER